MKTIKKTTTLLSFVILLLLQGVQGFQQPVVQHPLPQQQQQQLYNSSLMGQSTQPSNDWRLAAPTPQSQPDAGTMAALALLAGQLQGR